MKLSVCVMYSDNSELMAWRKSLPKDIEVIACCTVQKASLSSPEIWYIGSEDNTTLLTYAYPDFEESFSFADVRNVMDEHASGDWILHMDSDERFASPHEELFTYLHNLEESGAIAAYVTIAGVGHRIAEKQHTYRERYCEPNMRLHKRSAGIKWEGICHETLDIPLDNTLIADTDILIYHTGYSADDETMHAKAVRNAKLMIREYTRDKSERNWNYLINTFSYLKR